MSNLIRRIYLYLFTIVGLTLLVIGGVRFLDMGLKAFVFTEADKETELNYLSPYGAPPVERIDALEENGELTEKEREVLDNWIQNYESWQERREEINPVTARRQREASNNLAMILIGLPLYLYHWRLIKKESV